MPSLDHYMTQMKVSEPMRERIPVILNYFKQVLRLEFTDDDVFLCNQVLKPADTEPTIGNLWVVTDKSAAEAKNILSKVQFDIIRYDQGTLWIDFAARNYNFMEATEQSFLRVDCRFSTVTSGEFTAVGSNCDRLLGIVQRTFVAKINA